MNVISALYAETSKTIEQCYYFAGRHKDTIIRIKQALNSTGSMVGIAWGAVCWSVLVCSRLAMQMEVIPSPQTSVPVKLHTVTPHTRS